MGLPKLVSALMEQGAWPDDPGPVELRQTHVSWIFLTPTHVYKIKKPVDFAFLDFTTLEKRKRFCEEEVRLNRRLTDGVYLGVVAITMEGGRYLPGGAGEPVEYAVRMVRLPEDRMLNRLVEEGRAEVSMIERVAERVARFHRDAAANERISGFGTPEMIGQNTDENFVQTRDQRGTAIPARLYDAVKGYTDEFLSANRGLLERRAAEGLVRDCHGDIHCDHVSITNGINIFDCIEFNERFRYSDVVSDIAFLSMDLDYRNRADLAGICDAAYFRATGDHEGRRLLDFYKCYRAYVRGKVDGFKHAEPEVTGAEAADALISARVHYHLSGLYASGGFRPMMVVVCGLSGTGKSTMAAEMAEKTGLVRFSSDAIRKGLAGIHPGTHAGSGWGRGIYTREFTERTYTELISKGADTLAGGRSVILDATFNDHAWLEMARREALDRGACFRVVECAAPEGVIRKRLAGRDAEEEAAGDEALSDAGWEIYMEQKKRRTAIALPHVTVDTSRGAQAALIEATAFVFSGPVP